MWEYKLIIGEGKNQKAKVMKERTGSAGVSPAFSAEKTKGKNQKVNAPYDMPHPPESAIRNPQSAMFPV